MQLTELRVLQGRMEWPSRELVNRLRSLVKEMCNGGGDCGEFAVIASPYRICPLGAHIDHQGGAVTAMALDRGIALGFVPSEKSCVIIRSSQFPEELSFAVDGQGVTMCGGWGDYARGAVYALTSRGYHLRKGIIGLVDGSEGMHGCGISSSAALGVAFLLALEHANDLKLTSWENVELDRVIENEFLGVRNGVLDQSAILLSKRGCLTLVKCGEMSHEVVKLGSNRLKKDDSDRAQTREAATDMNGYKIMLAFSGLQHALTSKPGFNLRVSECKEAAKLLLKSLGRLDSTQNPILGHVKVEEYAIHKNKLQGDMERRARHFFTEHARVEAGVKAWSAGDMETFGRLVTESGKSSIENYECGCEELIQLWRIMCDAPGVVGARFSGAGFRGFCVALVKEELVEEASAFVSNRYREAQPQLWEKTCYSSMVVICDSGESARLLCPQ